MDSSTAGCAAIIASDLDGPPTELRNDLQKGLSTTMLDLADNTSQYGAQMPVGNGVQAGVMNLCSFSELLIHASKGSLCTEYSSMMTDYPMEMYQENGGAYYSAVESEHETTGYQSADDLDDDGYGADVDQQQTHFKSKCSSDDVCIADFDDNISKECFNNARDCIDCVSEYP
ncbi:hypothetical protein GQ55_3G215100 [Panicum hallii var. hallii]|uniref:Uncharacterized protein n=1 Tax=Panicum hallii var. hallii TaxID=1504633 RepID=A0A2T7EBX8_9POAL|nr:hypothetical protein GQ55_3G215100 [Panicum hallii var. hallii]